MLKFIWSRLRGGAYADLAESKAKLECYIRREHRPLCQMFFRWEGSD